MYECQNVPDVILKDNETLLLTCENCDITENEPIKNIVNFTSKWIKKFFYYCDLHKDKSKKFCKNCVLFLCNLCVVLHRQQKGLHEIIDSTNIDIYFCQEHNQKLNYYCNECKYEICNKCKDFHINHEAEIKAINDNNSDILNEGNFKNFLEKAEKIKKANMNLLKVLLKLLIKHLMKMNHLETN